MKTNIILIDYENVQKHDLRPLLNHDVLIKVFYNKNQKATFDFLNLAMAFGKEKFQAIQIQGKGKNAADFHIAYFIGKLAKEIPNPFFHIISKDTGFKPLVEFLKIEEKISCTVEASIAEIPLLKQPQTVIKPETPKTIDDWYSIALGKLTNSKAQKPKKKKTLRNQIISFCRKQITENEANAIIEKLIENKIIECKNESVIYK